MKRLFVLSLVAVLAFGLFSTAAFGQAGQASESGQTKVMWNFARSCDISIDVHGNLQLGDGNGNSQIGSNGTVIQNTGNTVATSGRCAYQVNVSSFKFTSPIGADIYDDFKLKVGSAGGTGGTDYTINLGSFKKLHGWNTTTTDTRELGEVTYNGLNTRTVNWNMDYQYTFDNDDMEGNYAVWLEYTVSPQ